MHLFVFKNAVWHLARAGNFWYNEKKSVSDWWVEKGESRNETKDFRRGVESSDDAFDRVFFPRAQRRRGRFCGNVGRKWL
jgi:hypothetical protein